MSLLLNVNENTRFLCADGFFLPPFNSIDWMLSSFIYTHEGTLLNIFCDITAMNVWTGVQTRIVNSALIAILIIYVWCYFIGVITALLPLWFRSCVSNIFPIHSLKSSRISLRLAAGSSPSHFSSLFAHHRFMWHDKIFIARIPNKIINSINIVCTMTQFVAAELSLFIVLSRSIVEFHCYWFRIPNAKCYFNALKLRILFQFNWDRNTNDASNIAEFHLHYVHFDKPLVWLLL